jgi:hypothetical protein
MALRPFRPCSCNSESHLWKDAFRKLGADVGRRISFPDAARLRGEWMETVVVEFQGSLSNLMIGDIVQILEAKQATGQLLMQKESTLQSGSIYLRRGQIVHVVSPNGSADPYALCELLEWEATPGGVFQFIADVDPGVLTTSLPNSALIIRCEVARDVFALIRQRYGTLNAVLRVVPAAPRIQLSVGQWRILRFVDDASTIRDTLTLTGAEPSEFIADLETLISGRVLAFERADASPAPNETPRAPSAIEILPLAMDALNALCVAYSKTLGDVVLSNYLRRVHQELIKSHPGLASLEVSKMNFADGFIRLIVAPEAAAAMFGDDATTTVRAFRAWTERFRRQCSGVVHALADINVRELAPAAAARLAALGFYDGLE